MDKQLLKDYIKNIDLDTVQEFLAKHNPKLEKAIKVIVECRGIVSDIISIKNSNIPINTKTITMGILEILSIHRKGKALSEFSADDWRQVVDVAFDATVKVPEDQYCLLVFKMYETVIDRFIATLPDEESKTNLNEIFQALKKLNDDYGADAIAEVKYIENAEMLCFEAATNIVAISISGKLPKYHDLVENGASLCFELVRYKLYRSEYVVLSQLQESGDATKLELGKEFAKYYNDVQCRLGAFAELIDKAFSSDFNTALESSILLAEASGVDSQEILRNIEDADTYFM